MKIKVKFDIEIEVKSRGYLMILKHFSVTGCNIKPDEQTDGQSAIL
jgi:hypothetical protein